MRNLDRRVHELERANGPAGTAYTFEIPFGHPDPARGFESNDETVRDFLQELRSFAGSLDKDFLHSVAVNRQAHTPFGIGDPTDMLAPEPDACDRNVLLVDDANGREVNVLQQLK